MFILLNTIDRVKTFTSEVSLIDAAIDLVAGRYVVNAKSIMGIFSLDLTKPLEIVLRTDENGDLSTDTESKFNELVEKYKA